jgi:hypothetical protein
VEGAGYEQRSFWSLRHADDLKTEQDIAAFLEAAAEEGGNDPAFMARGLDVVARARKRLGRPEDWNGLFDAIKAGGVPSDFLSPGERRG